MSKLLPLNSDRLPGGTIAFLGCLRFARRPFFHLNLVEWINVLLPGSDELDSDSMLSHLNQRDFLASASFREVYQMSTAVRSSMDINETCRLSEMLP
jgi:hypothetical protein